MREGKVCSVYVLCVKDSFSSFFWLFWTSFYPYITAVLVGWWVPNLILLKDQHQPNRHRITPIPVLCVLLMTALELEECHHRTYQRIKKKRMAVSPCVSCLCLCLFCPLCHVYRLLYLYHYLIQLIGSGDMFVIWLWVLRVA